MILKNTIESDIRPFSNWRDPFNSQIFHNTSKKNFVRLLLGEVSYQKGALKSKEGRINNAVETRNIASLQHCL